MGALTKRKWLSLSLLAVVLPVSFLITFRLIGVLPEPQNPETVTLEVVSWQMKRPSLHHLTVDERVENAYANDGVNTGVGIHIYEYFEDALTPPFSGRDGISLGTEINVTVLSGFPVSMVAHYHPTDEKATVYISKTFQEQRNITVTRMKQIGTKTTDAYIIAQFSSQSSYLKTEVYWVFDDQNSENHQLNVKLEVIYYNGTNYLKTVLPILLEMLIET